MTQLLAGVKAQGQTGAGVAIGTVTVDFNSDGTWDFTVGTKTYVYTGNDSNVNKLLELMFVGTGGLAAGTKLFGNA